VIVLHQVSDICGVAVVINLTITKWDQRDADNGIQCLKQDFVIHGHKKSLTPIE
jgi:hypothetical protein